MSLPEPKPIASLTKKSYRGICEYITENTTQENAQMLLDLMTKAMRTTTGFDPNVKTSPEICRKKTEQRKKLLEKEGTTHYEKYKKPRCERLKEQYPQVSAYDISRLTIPNLQKLSATNKISGFADLRLKA